MPSAIVNSFTSTRRVWVNVTAPSAMPRTITVSVWTPALPPCAATMVMNAAAIAICRIVPSKKAMTSALSVVVTKLSASQGRRRRMDCQGESNTSSSSSRPASL